MEEVKIPNKGIITTIQICDHKGNREYSFSKEIRKGEELIIFESSNGDKLIFNDSEGTIMIDHL